MRKYLAEKAGAHGLVLLENHEFTLNQDAVNFVLQNPDRPGSMTVISISGLEAIQNCTEESRKSILDVRFDIARYYLHNAPKHA
jgi:hypothetical protein